MTRAEEYLHLFDQRRLIDLRLTELADSFGDDPTGLPRLPRSGLRLVAISGVTLSKVGRADD